MERFSSLVTKSRPWPVIGRTIFFTSDKNRPTRDEIYFTDFWRENVSMYRIKVFSSHTTLKTNNLLDPVSYSYGSIFSYWHFQHIYTRSTKDKNNPKRKTFTYSAECRCFFPVSSWPQDIQQLVWKKPIGYTDKFKLILFFLDNGNS